MSNYESCELVYSQQPNTDVSPGQLNNATLSTSQRLSSCYRKILHVPWTQRRTNADIRNELEVPEGWLLNTGYRRKLKFFGHIKSHDSLVKAVLEGKVPGKRSRGRQRRRWELRLYQQEANGYTTDEAGRLPQNRVLY